MRRRAPDQAALETRLGYTFSDPSLLRQALTHGSAKSREPTYQRLEFLGDRVLALAASELLMSAFPDASEGDLSRRLSELVRRETCAAVGFSWDLGSHLRLGGNTKRAMAANPSIVADACEAVIGSVFLDGGYGEARNLVARGFGDKLTGLAENPSNPKTQLNEWAAAAGRPFPAYSVVERTGEDHAPLFRVAVRVDGLADAVGTGRTRRAAEQEAALAMLVREGVCPAPAPEREKADA